MISQKDVGRPAVPGEFNKLFSSTVHVNIDLIHEYDFCLCVHGAIREESRLRVFENRILRRIFGPKRDENGE